jgi:hypothetical protein
MVEAAFLAVKLIDTKGLPPQGVRAAIDGLLCDGVASDEKGIARFGYHAPGRHIVSVLRGGHFAGTNNSVAVELPPGLKSTDQVEPPEVRLQQAPVQVRVMWAGADPAPLDLQWSQSMNSSYPEDGGDGSSVFRNVGPGTWFLRAWTARGGDIITSAKFEVAAWTDTFVFEFKDGKLAPRRD